LPYASWELLWYLCIALVIGMCARLTLVCAFAVAACGQEPERPPLPTTESTSISTRPAEQGNEALPLELPVERALPSPPPSPPGLGAEHVAQRFGDLLFREAVRGRGGESGFRRSAIYVADSPNVRKVVLAVDHDRRLFLADIHFAHPNPRFFLREHDFGPGLLRVRARSRPPEEKARAPRDPRRPRRRVRAVEAEMLFHVDPGSGLRRVHEMETSSSSVASGGSRWDPSTETLTATVQPRNPPGRERCRRPAPEVTVYRWRDGHFEEVSRTGPGAPCGQRSQGVNLPTDDLP